MKIKTTFRFLFFIIISIFNNTSSQALPLSPSLISLNSSEGNTLLDSSQAKQDFSMLNGQFISQSNPAYSGIASMVMVLNSFKNTLPESSQHNLS